MTPPTTAAAAAVVRAARTPVPARGMQTRKSRRRSLFHAHAQPAGAMQPPATTTTAALSCCWAARSCRGMCMHAAPPHHHQQQQKAAPAAPPPPSARQQKRRGGQHCVAWPPPRDASARLCASSCGVSSRWRAQPTSGGVVERQQRHHGLARRRWRHQRVRRSVVHQHSRAAAAQLEQQQHRRTRSVALCTPQRGSNSPVVLHASTLAARARWQCQRSRQPNGRRGSGSNSREEMAGCSPQQRRQRQRRQRNPPSCTLAWKPSQTRKSAESGEGGLRWHAPFFMQSSTPPTPPPPPLSLPSPPAGSWSASIGWQPGCRLGGRGAGPRRRLPCRAWTRCSRM